MSPSAVVSVMSTVPFAEAVGMVSCSDVAVLVPIVAALAPIFAEITASRSVPVNVTFAPTVGVFFEYLTSFDVTAGTGPVGGK